jgi:hypothetical protein
MDETTHGFSRKVLDRAFTLEMSDVDLGNWKEAPAAVPDPTPWPIESWYPRALRLSDLRDLSDAERTQISQVVERLTEANAILSSAQVQVGYRYATKSRSSSCMRASSCRGSAPNLATPWIFDLALHMKLLPRLVGEVESSAGSSSGFSAGLLTGGPTYPTKNWQPTSLAGSGTGVSHHWTRRGSRARLHAFA